MPSLESRVPDAAAIAVGNAAWGLDIVVGMPVRECAPVNIWYNFTEVKIPDLNLAVDAGALSFHTPDTKKDQWMVILPPMGNGVLSWNCPVPAGHQFVLRGVASYEGVVKVESNGDGCSQQAPPATTTFDHGTMALPIFTSYLSASYAETTIATQGFLTTTYPSGSYPTAVVPLGLPVGAATTGPSAASSTSNSTDIPTSGSDGPPIGAIVGGVVGGLAIALLAIVCLFCWRRRRRQHHDAKMTEVSPLPMSSYSAPSTVADSGAAIMGSPNHITSSADRKGRRLEQMPSTSTLRSSPTDVTGATAAQGASRSYFAEDSFPPTTADGRSTVLRIPEDGETVPLPAPPQYTRLPA